MKKIIILIIVLSAITVTQAQTTQTKVHITSTGALAALKKIKSTFDLKNMDCYKIVQEFGLYNPEDKSSVILQPEDYFLYENGKISFHKKNSGSKTIEIAIKPQEASEIREESFSQDQDINKKGSVANIAIDEAEKNIAEFTAITGISLVDLGIPKYLSPIKSKYILEETPEENQNNNLKEKKAHSNENLINSSGTPPEVLPPPKYGDQEFLLSEKQKKTLIEMCGEPGETLVKELEKLLAITPSENEDYIYLSVQSENKKNILLSYSKESREILFSLNPIAITP